MDVRNHLAGSSGVQGAGVASMPTVGEQKPPSGLGYVENCQYLEKNFDRFADPKDKKFITRESLLNIAYPRRDSDFTPEESAFSRLVLSDHDLMRKLDEDAKGNLDEKIDRTNIRNVIEGKSTFKAGSVAAAASADIPDLSKWSDKQMTQYLGKHFDRFMDRDHKPEFVLSTDDSGDKEFVSQASLERVAKSTDGEFTPMEVAFASEMLSHRQKLFKDYEDPKCAIVDGYVSKRDVYDQLAVKRVYEGKEVIGETWETHPATVETYAVYGEDGDLLMKDRFTKDGPFGGARWSTEFF